MGIVNVTPDSFSDGGRYLNPTDAVAHGRALVEAGADILDIGGESTRPGAAPVDAAEEARRVLPVVEQLSGQVGVPLSIDTTKSEVARAAIAAGASIVNDVSAGRKDPEMLDLVANTGVGYVVMHMRGEPRTMQDEPHYGDVVKEVGSFLAARVEAARQAGVVHSALAADPGIGFGKSTGHNLSLLRALPELAEELGVPLVVGTSRKRFISVVLAGVAGESGEAPPGLREEGTLATVVWAVDHGAAIVRVHDVPPAARAVRLLTALSKAVA